MGRPKKGEKYPRTRSFKVTKEMDDTVRQVRKKEGHITFSEWIRKIIRNYIY